MADTSSVRDASGKGRPFFDPTYVRSENRREIRLAFILFWSILMWFFFRSYVVSVAIVGDVSMQPTLGQGDYYLVNKYIFHFVDPQRGDLVVFHRQASDPKEEVKRVVGLPGEILQIRSSTVYINGRRLDEPYAVGGTYPDFGPFTVEPDTYFVLGDTRWIREDSRDFGAVPVRNIVGKLKPGMLFPFR